MIARRPAFALGLAGFAVLCLAGMAGLLLLGPDPVHDGLVQTHIGSLELRYLRGYARFPAGREGGAAERLDLAAFFPGLAPAGTLAGIRDANDARERTDRTLFLGLRPADATLDPAERPMKLDARFLEAQFEIGPGGLLRRRFEPGTPYETNQLFIAPPEGRAFYALCAQPSGKPDDLPETCIHAFRTRGLEVEMRFSSKLLSDWERLIGGTKEFVDRLRVN